ncbi:MAG: Ribose 5-phosphate isomerase [Parcubacteria group bacterium GW2011_GWB1_40_14]|nr:MAG: Ribose 5-phosphate isomerase [Parcubacteria group bacterium GW2011_GWB1_40_14]
MKVYIGADHGGFKLKEKAKHKLVEWGFDVEDMGAKTLDPDDDYPEFAYAVAKKVSENLSASRGILLCRSGVGMDIVANKVKGIRSAQVFNEEMAKKSREHEDANVLTIATDYLPEENVLFILKIWLETPFSGDERHVRRLKQIEELEK